MNIQSLMANKNQIDVLVKEKAPDVIFMSETRTTDEILDHEINVDGYKIVRCDSHSRHTGGVAIYFKQHVQWSIISKYVKQYMWILAVRVENGLEIGLYVVVYRSPSCSKSLFLEELEQWCENNFENENNKIMVGDFNIDLLKSDTYTKKMETLRKFYGLKHYVNEPTRICKDSATLIDYVLSDFINISAEVDYDEAIADHATLKIEIKNSKFVEKSNIRSQVKLFKYSEQEMIRNLRNVNVREVTNKDFDFKTDFYSSTLKNATKNMIRYRTVYNGKLNKWYRPEFSNDKKVYTSALKHAVFTRAGQDFRKSNDLRNAYVQKIRNASNDYDKNRLMNCRGDQTKMWMVLKQIVKGNERTNIDYIKRGNEKIVYKKEIAESFNKYFVNSIIELNESVEKVDFEFDTNEINHDDNRIFKFKNIDMNYLNAIMKNIKLKSDEDNVNIQVIRDSMPFLGYVFLDIINQSLMTGKFPEKWKEAVVVPIPKKAGTKNIEEFRPINTLPTFEKILECVVKEQLTEYLEKHNILVDVQSGFRKSHSCETALNFVIAGWKEAMDRNEITTALFLDLRRAFETIDREILLKKLRNIGIRNNEFEWFKSYLTGRTQKVKINDVYSESIENKLGVSQGSALGPLLFLIYMNDIVHTVKDCSIKLFADDTLIYISGKNVEESILKMNNELKNLVTWLKMNKLVLNIEKTVYMNISSKRVETDSVVLMDDKVIKNVNQAKYLGIIMDSRLNFADHFDYVLQKMSRKISFLWRIRRKLDLNHRITVFMTVIAPHIEYCSTILFIMSEERIKKLQKLQNRAMRIILGCDRRTRIADMLSQLSWLMTVKQRLVFNSLVFIHRIKCGVLPSYLGSRLVYSHQVHDYPLRNVNRFRLPRCNKSMTKNNLFYKGLQMYEALSSEMKNEQNVGKFKKLCKTYVEENF
jgi:exonuclease III